MVSRVHSARNCKHLSHDNDFNAISFMEKFSKLKTHILQDFNRNLQYRMLIMRTLSPERFLKYILFRRSVSVSSYVKAQFLNEQGFIKGKFTITNLTWSTQFFNNCVSRKSQQSPRVVEKTNLFIIDFKLLEIVRYRKHDR